MHTSLLVLYLGAPVMIDCGLDWLGKSTSVPQGDRPHHPRPDDAWEFKKGAPCPVCTGKDMAGIQGLPNQGPPCNQKAYTGENVGSHLTRSRSNILSPAVGYRVSAGRACIFYAPDLMFSHERSAALQGVQIYSGDGATVTQYSFANAAKH